jgi:hypothetical protein
MLRSAPQLRIVGHGTNSRVRAAGDWERDPLEGLRTACRASRALETLTVESVQRARLAGHSWAQIGQALGITKQAAWERYSGED